MIDSLEVEVIYPALMVAKA